MTTGEGASRPGPLRRAAAAGLALALALPAPASAGLRPAYGGELRLLLAEPPRLTDPSLAVEPADLLLGRATQATPLQVDPQGRLVPGLLEEVPGPEAGGTAFHLRLRPGLRFADGTPLTAADLASSLTRLLGRGGEGRGGAGGTPHAWLALPIAGAEAVLEGRAAELSGLQMLSERELLVTLAFPLPEWPWGLAAPPAAVVSARGSGAGPFVLRALDQAGARLSPNPYHWRGRPFADRLLIAGADARAAARALSAGEADLVLRPEPAGAGATSTPPLLATVAVLNPRRLGPLAARVRAVLEGIDRADLARRYARGPAAPLSALVPPTLLPAAALAPASPQPGPAAALPGRLVLLAAAGPLEQRAAAERLQVKLFDAGARAAAQLEPGPRFAARLAAEDYDVALVSVPVLALSPPLAAGQVALAARGPAAARRAMAELSGLAPGPAAERAAALARALDLVPLFAGGQRASAGPALLGLRLAPDGGLDPGDLWRRRGEAR